jgi:hypothetical protein
MASPPSGGGAPPPAYTPPPSAAYTPPPSSGGGGGSNGMAIAALVLGIVAVVLFFTCGLGIFAGVLALVFGFLGLGRSKASGQGKGMSLAGLVLGAIGIIGGILFIVLVFFVGDTVSDNVDDAFGEADPSDYELVTESCEIDEFGFVTFEGTIENTAGQSMDFEILTEIRDKDTDAVLDDPSTFVFISEGDTVDWSVVASVDEGSDVECRVESVDNFGNFD